MINYQYKDILQPTNFIKNFSSYDDFEFWCLSGSCEDLKAMLKVFETNELYEHCAIIKKVIDEKYLEHI